LISLIISSFGKKLEKIGDDELLKLIQVEKYVVVLFSENNCGEKCDKLEHELSMGREVLVDNLGAWVVKLVSSPLAKLYSPTGAPAIVFFRDGSPMLYNGPAAEDDIISILQRSQNRAVKELNDDNFEHLTQAATGATTGDWLIMFYKHSCVTSSRLQAVLESVGSELKNRVNVARVESGTVTSRRFGIGETPSFLLLRHGKMYKYELDTINIPNLVNFATEFWRNSKGTPVPTPKSPFDDFTEMVVEKLKDLKNLDYKDPENLKCGGMALGGLIFLAILISCMCGGGKPAKKSVKKEATKKKK